MHHRFVRGYGYLLDHYAVACVFLAQFILTLLGVGDVRVVSMLGLLLCVAGLAQRCARTDLWVLLPLGVYTAACMGSAWSVSGDPAQGYGPLHLIFPVIYLLMSCLDGGERRSLRQLCAVWVWAVAAVGMGQFVFRAVFRDSAGRLGGLLGNPNALGAFLVAGWFLLMACREEEARLARLEPVVLAALALTLSMGSFLAMAAGILVLLAAKWRENGRKAALESAFQLLARASLGVGTGILLYLSAARSGLPWICLAVAAYAVALTVYWPELERFLARFPRMAAVIAFCGAGVAAVAVVTRPSAAATFMERLEMMSSAARYLTRDPLFGVGAFQWRMLDLQDGGTYFNTWHIHNVPLHVAVEMGWPAAAALILVAARLLRKKTPAVRAGFAAFCIHNLMDTGFFYLGITSLALISADNPGGGRTKLEGIPLKLLFGALAVVYAAQLCYLLLMG